MEARWWTKDKEMAVRCHLCFRQCSLAPGQTGVCGVRHNEKGELKSPYLGQFCSLAVDPIEKKPLYHWQPGTSILSLGSLGCTMRCPFCQNASIAQPVKIPAMRSLTIEECIALCREYKLSSLAFTYNEPTLQAEFICSGGAQLQEAGIATVLVTNGMFSDEVAAEFVKHVSALNIDVKTFNARNYTRMGGDLERVKRNVEMFVKAGRHVEVTRLLVPKLADDPEDFMEFVRWLSNLSPDIPLHLSRYFPAHNYAEPPTSLNLLDRFAELARKYLRHVYLGNVG